MALKLMYITNDSGVAQIAESAGVDRIFIDMEYIGKAKRQEGMDTVQSHHTVEDVRRLRKVISKAEVMVRVNPIHKATREYNSSKEEIEEVIEAGADLLMLPYFKTVGEVETFVKLVNGRVKTLLLLETPEAVDIVDEIMGVSGVDEMFIGLNDLSLGYRKRFMFELLSDGTVERLCAKFRQRGIPYGFGGIAALGKGKLPSEYVIKEHYRLGSACVILSRSFCDTNKVDDMEEIASIFKNGVQEIRNLETECEEHMGDDQYFKENRQAVSDKVKLICEELY